MVLVLSGWVQWSLPNWLAFLGMHDTFPLYWAPQVCVSLFIGAFLGPILGPLCVLVFLVGGLTFLPWFSQGGGLDYLKEPGMGYLLGMFIGALTAARLTRKPFLSQKSQSLPLIINLVFVIVQALIMVHGIGAVALMVHGFLGWTDWTLVWQYVLYWTLLPIGYEMLVCLGLFLMVRPLRALFWLALY